MLPEGIGSGKSIDWFLYKSNIATEYLKDWNKYEQWCEINPYGSGTKRKK